MLDGNTFAESVIVINYEVCDTDQEKGIYIYIIHTYIVLVTFSVLIAQNQFRLNNNNVRFTFHVHLIYYYAE